MKRGISIDATYEIDGKVYVTFKGTATFKNEDEWMTCFKELRASVDKYQEPN